MDSHETWASVVEGGGKSRRSPPPPAKNHENKLIHPYRGPFRHVRAFLLLFSPYGGPFFAIWGLLCYVFHHVGAFLLPFSPYRRPFFSMWGVFFGLAPLTTKISASTNGKCHDIILNVKFVENTLSKKFISSRDLCFNKHINCTYI